MMCARRSAQVSCNLLDHELTGLSQVFDAVCEDARALALPVVGSQLVGLVPLAALLAVADHCIRRENLLVLDEDQKVSLACVLYTIRYYEVD